MQAALRQLHVEGAQLFKQRDAHNRRQQLALLQQQQAADEALLAAGKTPPPRKQQQPLEDVQPSLLDSLSMHEPAVYMLLLRTFAVCGDVEGCYALLTTLYQLSMHHNGLERWQNEAPQQQELLHPHASMKQRMEQARRQQQEVEQDKQRNERRSPFTPTAATLAVIMSAYSHSSQLYDLQHHQQLFTHHSTLNVDPTVDFHRELLVYHATHHTVHTYLASLALLTRRRQARTEVYVRAIIHFGLIRKDHDSALVIFLAMSSLFSPSAAAFNAMIAVFGEKGEWMLAARLMDDMQRQGHKLSTWTYAGVVKALLVGGKEKEGKAMYEYVRATKLAELKRDCKQVADNMHRVMLEWAQQHSDVEAVTRLWQEAKADGVALSSNAYQITMSALLAAGRVSAARDVLDRMLRWKVEMQNSSYPTALQVLAAAKDYEAARALHTQYVGKLRQTRVQISRVVYVTLLSAVPAPQADRAVPVEKAVSVCRYCVSLLRDLCEDGTGMPSGFVREVCDVFSQYGAEIAAHRLDKQRTEKRGEAITTQLLEQLERDITLLQQPAGTATP